MASPIITPPAPSPFPGVVEINLTPLPVYIDNTMSFPLGQDLDQILDVSRFRSIDLSLAVLGVVGSGSLTISMITSMSISDPALSWMGTGNDLTFTSAGYQSSACPASSRTLLRYLRWAVGSFTGFTSAVFTIRGVGYLDWPAGPR